MTRQFDDVYVVSGPAFVPVTNPEDQKKKFVKYPKRKNQKLKGKKGKGKRKGRVSGGERGGEEKEQECNIINMFDLTYVFNMFLF